MADLVQLTDGTKTIDLAFSPGVQEDYRLHHGMSIRPETRPLWHQADDYPPELVDLVDENRVATLTLLVDGSSRDAVLDKLTTLKRWVDGANQQAARFWMRGDVKRIVLKVKRDGATNATLHPVIYGIVDDAASHWSGTAYVGGVASDVVVTLFLAPYGEAETPIVLRNRLPSSPHMIEDSDANGTPDSITGVNAPTITHAGAHSLIGSHSVRVVTNNSSSQGIISAAVPGAIGAGWHAKVYIATETSDPLTIAVTNDSITTVYASVTHNPSNPTGYVRAHPPTNGHLTWYEYRLGGVIPSGSSGALLRVLRPAANATQASTFYVDGMYIDVAAGAVAPEAYSSSRMINNRNDPSNTNPNQINYLDVWGIPGDAPALVDIQLAWTNITGGKALLYAGRVTDGEILASQIAGWIESNSFGTPLAFAASWSTGTGSSNDHYFRLTQNGSGTPGDGQISVTISGDAARRLLAQPLRVFGRCRSSSTATRFKLNISPPGGDVLNSEQIGIKTVNQWELVDFGLLNAQGRAPFSVPDTSEPDVDIFFSILNLPANSSATADFDALILIPTEEFAIIDFFNTFSTGASAYIRGTKKDALLSNHGVVAPARLGTMFELEPGPVMNRIRFAIADRSSNLHTLSDAANVTLTITPRTRHLLGTI